MQGLYIEPQRHKDTENGNGKKVNVDVKHFYFSVLCVFVSLWFKSFNV